MVCGDFKDLTRRTISDEILHDKAFNVAKNPKYNGYQLGLASVVYNFFNKKTVSGAIKNEIMSAKELAEQIQNRII